MDRFHEHALGSTEGTDRLKTPLPNAVVHGSARHVQQACCLLDRHAAPKSWFVALKIEMECGHYGNLAASSIAWRVPETRVDCILRFNLHDELDLSSGSGESSTVYEGNPLAGFLARKSEHAMTLKDPRTNILEFAQSFGGQEVGQGGQL